MPSDRMLEALVTDPTLWDRAAMKVWESLLDTGNCWEYLGHTNKRNHYGSFTLWVRGANRSQVFYAHRVAYADAAGLEQPPDGVVMHICDNPVCCNPSHLAHGTQADNLKDMRAKHRHAFGEKVGTSKLSEADVAEIIRLGKTVSYKILAVQFGVRERQIHRILKGTRWAHMAREMAA